MFELHQLEILRRALRSYTQNLTDQAEQNHAFHLLLVLTHEIEAEEMALENLNPYSEDSPCTRTMYSRQ